MLDIYINKIKGKNLLPFFKGKKWVKIKTKNNRKANYNIYITILI